MNIWVDVKTLKDEHFNQIQHAFAKHHVSKDEMDRKNADIAILMPGLINEEFISQMLQLKFVQCLTAGYDRADLSVLKRKNILFAYAKDVFSIQIAEDVLAKILFINRRLADYYNLMNQKIWEFKPITYEIYGSTIGIVGAGSIGNEIAKRLKSFGCHIIGFRRTSIHNDYYDEMVHDKKGLNHLLRSSDYVIIALPLNDETKDFIGKKELSIMKKSALLINVARGEIVDQDALINALNNKDIRGAALDVTTPEPLPSNHLLWSSKNIFITPHQASSSPKMHTRLVDQVIDSCKTYLNGEKLDNLVSL